MEKVPEYFIGLVSQYTGSINVEQSERYARSVIEAWYFSLDEVNQKKLHLTLPAYLAPKKNIFNHILRPKPNPDQDAVFTARLMQELSITDPNEVKQVASGVLKSLKIVSSQKDKFVYSELIRGQRLKKIFIES